MACDRHFGNSKDHLRRRLTGARRSTRPGGTEAEHVQLLINAAPRQQFPVPPRLHNLPVVEHQDHVRVLNGGETMGDANGGPPFHEFVQRGLDHALGFVVQ